MITNGFTYIAVLVFIAALLVWLQRYTKSKFFDYAPPIVLLYLITMILCTLGAWDMEATKPAYSVLKNNLLYAMIFLMLLRCDIRKIIKLGPKMLGGFFAASVSISVAFIATFAIMKGPLGSEAWKALGALCGSWMGGSGNMIAVQAALDIGEADMAYALVVDSIDYSIWVMFLLWAINLAPKFNKWVKADTTTLDEVSRRLEEDAKSNEDKASFVNLIFLLGLALVISAFGQDIGAALNSAMPFLDKATWTVLLITLSGLIGAVTPVGRMAGSTELSNLLLYSVVALLASRASFLELTDAPAWILAGFMILAIHGIILVLLAKIFHLDMFTCGVASLANIGGSASAPILAGAYSGALVPVGVLMALMGYVIGTAGGTAKAKAGTQEIAGGSYVWHDGIAYFSDEPMELTLEERTGKWSTVNGGNTTGEETKNVFQLGQHHGVRPDNGTYSYRVLFGKTEEETAAYAKGNQVQILHNDDKVQAVYHSGLKMAQIIMWKMGTVELPGGMSVTSNKKCMLIIQEQADGSLSITASNPENLPKDLWITVNRTLPVLKDKYIVNNEDGSTTIKFRLNEGVYAGSSTVYNSKTGFDKNSIMNQY